MSQAVKEAAAEAADLPAEMDPILFRITPTVVHFIDNTVSFGHRDIIEV